jgi:hypothetical protein
VLDHTAAVFKVPGCEPTPEKGWSKNKHIQEGGKAFNAEDEANWAACMCFSVAACRFLYL